MTKRAFTLLELIIVIVIIGILAIVGLSQYQKTKEKARWAEAKEVIGLIRKAQTAFYFENNCFATSIAELNSVLPLDFPVSSCMPSHWFTYSTQIGPSGCSITAIRCTEGGKNPQWGNHYRITIWVYKDGRTGDWLVYDF